MNSNVKKKKKKEEGNRGRKESVQYTVNNSKTELENQNTTNKSKSEKSLANTEK